jgi:hypothetical protein
MAWAWALTDHDEVGGVARAARRRGAGHGTCGRGGNFGHLGRAYGAHRRPAIDETNRRWSRDWPPPATAASRAREIAEALDRHGICGAYEGALKHVGNPDLISRTHFARYLVECGTCAIPRKSSPTTSPKASRATCRTAGPRWKSRCAGSAGPAGWR